MKAGKGFKDGTKKQTNAKRGGRGKGVKSYRRRGIAEEAVPGSVPLRYKSLGHGQCSMAAWWLAAVMALPHHCIAGPTCVAQVSIGDMWQNMW